jgi:hypothetical protein
MLAGTVEIENNYARPPQYERRQEKASIVF